MKTNLTHVERRRMMDIEAQTKARVELREVTDGTAETIALERSRGEEIHTPTTDRGGRPKPARRVAGLDFLLAKRLIDARQYQAGEKYGSRVQAGTPGLGSCLDFRDGVSMPHSAPYTLAEIISYAKAKLREDRDTALRNNPRLVAVADAVCGFGKRPSGLGKNQREAEQQLDWLLIALDHLADHYGL